MSCHEAPAAIAPGTRSSGPTSSTTASSTTTSRGTASRGTTSRGVTSRGATTDTSGPVGTAVLDEPRIVLVGNPNVGKSTLFNALTGSRQRVVNAPGTTVELQEGRWRVAGVPCRLVDLPGTYSLDARSPDEQVAAHAVHDDSTDLVVLLLDAAGLARSLVLAGQVASAARPVVVALTMTDVARTRGLTVPSDTLAEQLGVPVVVVDPRTGAGLDWLASAVALALTHPRRLTTAPTRRATTPGTASDAALSSSPDVPLDAAPDAAPDAVPSAATDAVLPDAASALGGAGEAAAVDTVASDDEAERVFAWAADVLTAVQPRGDAPRSPVRTWSDRVDRVLLDPRAGIPVLLVVMWALFQLATTVAAPLIAAVDTLVNGWLADAVRATLPSSGPWHWLEGLLVDGALAGVGTVLSFVPLLALVFVAVALLEDCGYLARAAFVADRAMRAIGLDGRAVLPLVVGFGCNLPALAATRTLPHARQRLLTGLLIPFTSCTARLTVYVLLASVFFPEHAGTVIFVMYLASAALVVLGGLALRRTLFRDVRREPLVLALPAYQRPAPRPIALSVWVRVLAFARKAGVIIVGTLTAVWLLMAIPVTGHHAIADVPVQDSLYGRAASTLAPVLAPAGFGTWEAAAALATGFVAKEVVVGSLAQTAAVAEPDDPARPGDLGDRLRATFERSSGGHAGAAAAGFLWFVLAYSPCLATLAEQRRMFGMRWTALGVGVGFTVAWVGAVVVFQVGRLLG